MAKYLQGKFTPKNPGKYRGDASNIVFRSSWELHFMQFCDTHPGVLEWGSEEIVIPYKCPVRGTIHRYFPDFHVRMRKADGTIVERLIEIKPKAQTKPPVKPARMTRKYKKDVITYVINQRKWEVAEAYAKSRNMEFEVLTEQHLGLAR